MRKLSSLVIGVFLLLNGCGSMYVDPGQQPAFLQVQAQGCLDPAQVREMLEFAIMGPSLFHSARFGGTIQGPWWSIRAYARTPDGELRQLQPATPGLFDSQVTYNFRSQRQFIIPAGNYTVEVWLESYMYYCTDFFRDSCGTPTIKLWRETLATDQFAPGQRLSVTINGNACGSVKTNEQMQIISP